MDACAAATYSDRAIAASPSVLARNGGFEPSPGVGGYQIFSVANTALTTSLSQEQPPESCLYSNDIPIQRPHPKAGDMACFNGDLNLQALIEYLALSAVCIGLGPAVRKVDIDKALMNSVARC